MKIIGLNCFRHLSSVAVIDEGGSILFAAEEERFNREKYTGKFPHGIFDYLFKNGILAKDEEIILAYYVKPLLGIQGRLPTIIRNFPKSLSWGRTHGGDFFKMLNVRKYIPLKVKKTYFVEHHLAHAASSFFPTPFNSAAILSIDGSGERSTYLLAKGSKNRIEKIYENPFPHSLGYFYSAIVRYLGFQVHSGDGKVMGLSSYGKPEYFNDLDEMITVKENRMRIDLSYFEFQNSVERDISKKFIRRFGPRRDPESEITTFHENMAASLQRILEKYMLLLSENLYEETGEKKLCLAGGVALNSVANGLIQREGPFEDIFVQPSANDAGTALGAALYVQHSILGRERKYIMDNAYLGSSYSDDDIKIQLHKNKLPYSKRANIEKAAAQELSRGKIVGWYQGKMEFGPRALGNRSILADPRKGEMKDILNERVKHREGFRPFAPSILEEKAGEYFKGCVSSPFMLFVFDVLDEKKNDIPAVVHIDGTARVQTVNRKQNPGYYDLIREFEMITGVPVVLNTSFNIRGEPIVNSPAEAIETFLKTDIDVLILGDYLIVDKTAV
ncbi:carbamoyl transferase [bacterium]|nr:carbamoyl transferase [bacterium]